jgi:hypothetical protein
MNALRDAEYRGKVTLDPRLRGDDDLISASLVILTF